MTELLCLKCLYLLLLYKVSPTVLDLVGLRTLRKIHLFVQRLGFLFRWNMLCCWRVFWWDVIGRELVLCEFAQMSPCDSTRLISPLTVILKQIFWFLDWVIMMVINIRRLLSPLNLMYFLSIGLFITLTQFRLSFINKLINLVNNNINFMGSKFMKIPLWWHHKKWRNDQLTVKHQPYQFNVIVTILFPQIIGWDIWQFCQPFVYSDLFMFCYLWEVFMVDYLFVYCVEFVIVIVLSLLGW